MINDDLLKILACPEDRTPLAPADEELLARVNRAIATGSLKTRGGQKVSDEFTAGLVREDGQVFYPIVDDIPVLLIDEGIALEDLSE